MRRPGGALALAMLALAVAGCASSQSGLPAAKREPPAALADVPFTPIEGDPGRLAWSAKANFFEVTAFLDSLGTRFPQGCSARLSLRFAEMMKGRALVHAGGTVVRERGALGPAACVGWARLVRALDGLADSIPLKAWTKDLAQDGDRLELRGLIRGTEEEVGTFSRALAAAGPFEETRVVSVRPTRQDGLAVLAFELELRFRDDG